MDTKILPKPLEFEWDSANSRKNLVKHSVANDQCEEVFEIDRFLLLKDHAHSIIEDRYLIIGPESQGKILVLAITLRGLRVRIISARPANKKERKFYEKTFKAH